MSQSHVRQFRTSLECSHANVITQQPARCDSLTRGAQSHHISRQSQSLVVSGVHVRSVCRALNSTVSTTRARPFDILYNLSLHAELLFSPARDSNQVLPACAACHQMTHCSACSIRVLERYLTQCFARYKLKKKLVRETVRCIGASAQDLSMRAPNLTTIRQVFGITLHYAAGSVPLSPS